MTIVSHESGIKAILPVPARGRRITITQGRERSGSVVRVLDSRPRGRGFEPHRRHCVVVLEQDTFILA